MNLEESLMNSIHSFTHSLRQKKNTFDLIFHEFIFLRSILRISTDNEKPIYPSDLSKRFNLSRSYVTAVLNSLESKQYILRDMDTMDRRRIQVNITQEGRNVLEQMALKEKEIFTQIINGLGEQNSLQFIALLNDSSQIIKEYGDKENG